MNISYLSYFVYQNQNLKVTRNYCMAVPAITFFVSSCFFFTFFFLLCFHSLHIMTVVFFGYFFFFCEMFRYFSFFDSGEYGYGKWMNKWMNDRRRKMCGHIQSMANMYVCMYIKTLACNFNYKIWKFPNWFPQFGAFFFLFSNSSLPHYSLHLMCYFVFTNLFCMSHLKCTTTITNFHCTNRM